jgi:hypothetical protein
MNITPPLATTTSDSGRSKPESRIAVPEAISVQTTRK